jgi:hypothetical protein
LVPDLQLRTAEAPKYPAEEEKAEAGEQHTATATLYVAAGSSKDFPIYIGDGGARVCWEFSASAHGGWFGFKDTGDVQFEVIFLAGLSSGGERMYQAEAVQNVTGLERTHAR